MDVEDFTHEIQPHHKRSRLLKFKEQIGALKRKGYSDMQIRQWLTQNGCEVSRENVRRFIKRYLPDLDDAPQLASPEALAALPGTGQIPQLAKPTERELSGIGRKESTAERILRETREQRNEATHNLFRHDKTGNNH
jgi:Holliday junction resolvasome RuvABC DNA-binding subunit